LGFYTGDIFTPQPSFERDIVPIIELFERTKPDIITVAMDPEASGPDTHYKVLQGVAEALRAYIKNHDNKKILVLGYRNVWYKFHPAHADVYVPATMSDFALLKSAFLTCFGSQKTASFPSHEYDGPFSDLAQNIMANQYKQLKFFLGRDFFYAHDQVNVRAARGFCFLKYMTPEEFFVQAQILQKNMELHML
jgi:glucosamine-6-phosphate deaminase